MWMKNEAAVLENGVAVPYKFKYKLPYDPAVPPGIYPREMETSVHTTTCTWMFM